MFYILSGELYEAKQNWVRRNPCISRRSTFSPDQPLASNNLAYVILEQGGNVGCCHGPGADRTPWHARIAQSADTLGWALLSEGNLPVQRFSQFQEALRLSEKRGAQMTRICTTHLGLAYEKNEQTALARQQLEKAIKLKPNNTEAAKALSDLRG